MDYNWIIQEFSTSKLRKPNFKCRIRSVKCQEKTRSKITSDKCGDVVFALADVFGDYKNPLPLDRNNTQA